MADYIGIKGGKVQNFSTNPPAPIAGQVWYNETTATINYRASNPAGAWATGNNMNTARYTMGGCGTQTAAIGFAGGYPNKNETELYNGSTWTEVNNVNTARRSLAASISGTSTATIGFGGNPNSADNESWNGTSWTELNNLNTARYGLGGAGTSTAAIGFGGDKSPVTAENELWNGTSWSEVGDLNTARLIYTGNAGKAQQLQVLDQKLQKVHLMKVGMELVGLKQEI